MMSQSTDFEIRRDYMKNVFKCGRHKFDKMITEAKDAGNLGTITSRNAQPQFQARYELTEVDYSDLERPYHLGNTTKGEFACRFLNTFPTQPKNRIGFEFHLQNTICEVVNRSPKRKAPLPKMVARWWVFGGSGMNRTKKRSSTHPLNKAVRG